MNTENYPELERNEYTEFIFGETCLEDPTDPQSAEDLTSWIERAVELDARPVFLEGVCERLNQLGISCTAEDTDIMLAEIRRRYKECLGFPCPRTVEKWIKGSMPGFTSIKNNYDLCYALEMDFNQTAIFFQKHYLSMPFNAKAKVDAVFLYCLYHRKPYSVVAELLEKSNGFVSQEKAHTSTAQIRAAIFDTDDDEQFLRYLSKHCYNDEQQFQTARALVNEEINKLKEKIRLESSIENNRLNSMTIAAMLGYKYQLRNRDELENVLPKRFTDSLPKDVTLGQIIRGEKVSYEVLRKYLVLLKFCNYYRDAEEADKSRSTAINKYEVNSRLMDFYGELNRALNQCGFSLIYPLHPFDCLVLYCANTFDPILSMHLLNERN